MPCLEIESATLEYWDHTPTNAVQARAREAHLLEFVRLLPFFKLWASDSQPEVISPLGMFGSVWREAAKHLIPITNNYPASIVNMKRRESLG